MEKGVKNLTQKSRAEALVLAQKDPSWQGCKFQALRTNFLNRTVNLRSESFSERNKDLSEVKNMEEWNSLYKKYNVTSMSKEDIEEKALEIFCARNSIKVTS